MRLYVTKSPRGSAFWFWTPTSTGRLAGYNGECPNYCTVSRAASQVNRHIGYFQPQANYGSDLTWMATPTTLLSVKAGCFGDNYKDTGLPNVTPVNFSTSASALPFEIPAPFASPPISTIPPAFSRSNDIGTKTYIQAQRGCWLSQSWGHLVWGWV